MRRTLCAVAAACAVIAVSDVALAQQKTLTGLQPTIVGHRGFPGLMPDHTLEGYRRAIEAGADFIEPDLVATKDGALIARHEPMLGQTTDVAQRPEFASRKTTKRMDGVEVTDWFASDFTLAEIKTLHAKERVPFRNQSNNGKFAIPTFAEILDLRAKASKAQTLGGSGREIGIYPETKHPSYFVQIGLPLEEPMLAALKTAGLDTAHAPVFLQSFEPGSLKKLAALTSLRRVQLLPGPGTDISDAGLAAIAMYAQGIGPAKQMIVPVDKAGNTAPPTDLIARAHRAGLIVHPYTFRPEKQFLPVTYGGDPAQEYCQFVGLGVDGLFTDTPDLALKVLATACR